MRRRALAILILLLSQSPSGGMLGRKSIYTGYVGKKIPIGVTERVSPTNPLIPLTLDEGSYFFSSGSPCRVLVRAQHD
jgi:hypothetical protein